MDDIENDSDWDTEEFQAALKTVLKYEIQSLLERLSHTGEETVLLTVNTVDMCVGHLASSNAQKFVNSVDIGQIKSKFLQFITGQPPNRMGLQKPRVNSDLDCGSFSDSELNSQGNWNPPNTGSKSVGKRAHEPDSALQENQNPSLKRQKVEEVTPQIKPQLRKNVNMTSSTSTPGTVKTSDQLAKMPIRGPLADGDNTREKLQELALNKSKLDIKLSTTKIVSKSGGFTEERLSDMQFKNLLKLCNTDIDEEEFYDDEEDDEEEEDEDDDDDESDLHLQHLSQVQQGQSKFNHPNLTPHRPSVQGIAPKPVISSSAKPGVRSNSQEQDVKGKNDLKLLDKSITDNKSVNTAGNMKKGAPGPDFTRDGGPVRTNQNVTVKDNDTSQIKINPLLNMPEIKEEPDPDDTAYRQNNQSSTASIASQDKHQGVKRSDKTPNQEKDIRLETSMNANVKDGNPNTQTLPLQRKQRPISEDDLDTETLILMAKAKHKETESDADKAIQAKLGQLSSKLSWVVEYPKDSQESWQPFPAENLHMAQSHGNSFPVHPGMEDEEEEEDDYEEEDFEEELDEEELAALKAIQSNKLKQLQDERMEMFHGEGGLMGRGEFRGNMGPMPEMEYHGGYGNEEMEGEYDEYGYNPEEVEGEEEDDGGMVPLLRGNYEHMQQGVYPRDGGPIMSQDQQHYLQRPPSPTQNFLLMGIMAKCLLCNKIIRKTEMTSHNQMHLEEEEEEDNYEEDGMGEEEEWLEEGHDLGAGEGHIPEGEDGHDLGADEGHGLEELEGEYTGNEGESLNEDGRLAGGDGQEHYKEESEQDSEFTAETFVAEKIELVKQNQTGKKPKPSTVCDICNKQFKSVSNLQRHRKIHTDAKLFPCPKCDKTFKLKPYVVNHLKKKHPDFDLSSLPQEEGNEKTFKCRLCNESFAEEDNLWEHIKSLHKVEW